jgi:23S rRNA pseudouridine1911/1915/1917 synthase
MNMTLLERLRENFPNAKRQNLKRMVEDRRVLINESPASRLDQKVSREDRVVVAPVKKISARLPFRIVYEDTEILVIDKPAGWLTSTVPGEKRPTVISAVDEYLSRTDRAAKAGLVHRLDRDASGLLVFAKNNRGLASLKRQFFYHTVDRVYHAIVSPGPREDEGKIDSRLIERADGSVRSTRDPKLGRRAITTFRVTERRGEFTLLRVELHTGRKHQIRAQLSERGWPIVGDRQYGGKNCTEGLMLAAVELGLDHPKTGKRMSWTILPHRVLSRFIAVGDGPDRV